MYPWHECLLVIRSIHVPLLDSVAGGDMVNEFGIPKHVTKNVNGTLKSVHTEVSGLLSSDDESTKIEMFKSDHIKLAEVPYRQLYCRRSLEQIITFCDSEGNCRFSEPK